MNGGVLVRRIVDPAGVAPGQGYAPAVAVTGATYLVFLSGQGPVTPDGRLPDGIEAQTRQVWANITDLLAAADLTPDNLVKVTVFLADGAHRVLANHVSDTILAGRLVAWTTVIAGLVRPDWLIEIEAVAVA
jgi:2-iminobutanoate/2-iminopropanoate deaminase